MSMGVSELSRGRRGALQSESALLFPNGESFSSGGDDAGGQRFKVDASAEERVHGLIKSPASDTRTSVQGRFRSTVIEVEKYAAWEHSRRRFVR
jgi:hypothetical protein